MQDQNTVMYRFRDTAEFAAAREYIERRIAERHNPQTAAVNSFVRRAGEGPSNSDP